MLRSYYKLTKKYLIEDVDLDVLLRHADEAMYQAKRAGKNTVYLHGD